MSRFQTLSQSIYFCQHHRKKHTIKELQTHFLEMLGDQRREHGIDSHKTSLTGQFADLISELSTKYSQKVAILVDEYNKPILDNIEKPALAAVAKGDNYSDTGGNSLQSSTLLKTL